MNSDKTFHRILSAMYARRKLFLMGRKKETKRVIKLPYQSMIVTRPDELQASIDDEVKANGDILQSSVYEGYGLLSFKTNVGYIWSSW